MTGIVTHKKNTNIRCTVLFLYEKLPLTRNYFYLLTFILIIPEITL